MTAQEQAEHGNPQNVGELLLMSHAALKQQDWHNSYLKAGCYHPPKSRPNFCEIFSFADLTGDNLVDLFTELQNLSTDLYESGNPGLSAECARYVTLMAPDHKDGYLLLYRALLAIGRFKEAGAAYIIFSEFVVRHAGLAMPFWKGEDLTGKTLCVFAGAGIGDTIQNIRFLNNLSRLCDSIEFYVKKSLWKLMGNIKNVTFYDLDPTNPGISQTADFVCSLYAVPFVLGLSPYMLSRDLPCLHADPDRVSQWSARMPAQGMRIGIVWQSAGPPGQGRNIPLKHFAPLARLPGVTLISLQLDTGLDQLRDLPDDMPVRTLGDGFDAGPDAMLDTVAVMQSLDLILTCDTSLGHIAGCSGRPVWLLAHSIPDARWMLDRAVTSWYPTMRLFVQTEHGNWDQVMTRVTDEVKRTIEQI